jgi:hypothetical protein
MWWRRRPTDDDGDATHVSSTWRAQAVRDELRAGWDGPVWRTPAGKGSLWDIARDEDRRRRRRSERALKLAGGRG